MDKEKAEIWLAKLKSAWENQRPADAAKLFAKTAEYYERPFAPVTSQEGIRRLWDEILEVSEITFNYEIAAIDRNRVFVRWQNDYTINATKVHEKLDGIFQLDFDEDGNCVEFRQWWFMKEGE